MKKFFSKPKNIALVILGIILSPILIPILIVILLIAFLVSIFSKDVHKACEQGNHVFTKNEPYGITKGFSRRCKNCGLLG